jgi:hypothetical protein
VSWYQYLAIVQDAKTMAREEERFRTHPVACPNDGEPLRSGPHGGLFCPWGDWFSDDTSLPPGT